ncbi:MAG: 1,4-dihydroxy-2-naphthoate octaprenyltransferase [Parachlamydiaceae bacterium]|nr:1,4-dihydroxy-2-naphthoate octaprenyltransferase [Parachlamydiaceae bacterium]
MYRDKRLTASTLFIWLQTIRPKTLTAAIVPFCAGAALAYSGGSTISWELLFYALASALCIQIASNLLNDAFDFVKDTADPRRLGPQRAIHLGIADGKQMYFLGMVFFLFAWLFAIPLIIHGGSAIVVVLLFSMLAAYFYSGGPLPLTSVGLGDPFVFLFYGWIATAASYWLQAHVVDAKAILLGTQIGLLCTTIIAVDNYRDIESDEKDNKKTLAVRFGPKFAKFEIAFLTFFPFSLNFLWLLWGYVFAAILPMLAAPLAGYLVARIWKTRPSRAYNHFLALAALLHLCFGALLILGFILAG